MKISKKDALSWFTFFAALPEDEEIQQHQQEIIYAVFSQIEDAVDARNERLMGEIPHLKNLQGRTLYVGDEKKFPRGCCSCLLGTGLTAIRKTNKCNLQCPFCYDFGEMDCQPPVGEGLWEIGGTRFRERDIPLLLSIQKKPTGISYVYLEPFMEIEKYYGLTTEEGQDLTLTETEIASLTAAFELSMLPSEERVIGEQEELLYGGYEPLSMAVSHIINNKAGLSFTSYAHTGLQIPVYAMGVGADNFSGLYDNTDIFNKLAAMLAVK